MCNLKEYARCSCQIFGKFSNVGFPAQGRVEKYSEILDKIGSIYGFRAKLYSNKMINHFRWRMKDDIVCLSYI